MHILSIQYLKSSIIHFLVHVNIFVDDPSGDAHGGLQ